MEFAPGRIRLKVPRPQVSNTCRTLLEQLPVVDIDIAEVAIEDIIRRLFVRSGSSGPDPKEETQFYTHPAAPRP
jgi:hypothetical protein